MRNSEMAIEIAKERGLDLDTRKGWLELINILLDYQDDAIDFLQDTVLMIDNIDKAYADIAEDIEDVA